MAARWTTPAASTPTYKAMKMYRNYDGNKSTFGDTSVAATAPNPDNVSAFAAQRRADGALTVMVVNKYLSGDDAGDDRPRELHAPRHRAGLAADVGQRDRAAGRRRAQRRQPRRDAARAERHAVRGASQRTATPPRRRRTCALRACSDVGRVRRSSDRWTARRAPCARQTGDRDEQQRPRQHPAGSRGPDGDLLSHGHHRHGAERDSRQPEQGSLLFASSCARHHSRMTPIPTSVVPKSRMNDS